MSQPNNKSSEGLNKWTKLKLIAYGHYTADLTAPQSLDALRNNNHNVHRATIFRWFNQFKNNQLEFVTRKGKGRKKSVDKEERIKLIKDAIEANRYITYRDLKKLTGIPTGTIAYIIRDDLKVKKLKSVWVPTELSKSQKETRVKWCIEQREKFQIGSHPDVKYISTGDETWMMFKTIYSGNKKRWVFSDEDYPRLPKVKPTVKKRMYCVFFNSKEVVQISVLPQNETFNSIDYISSLQEMAKNISNFSCPKIILQQDNCRVHYSHLCQYYYKSNRIELMSHPAYSPDLAPCDFWLFRILKQEFRGKEYQNENDLAAAVYEYLGSIPQSEYQKCFNEWFERMKRCIEMNGEYFEIKRRALKQNRNNNQ